MQTLIVSCKHSRAMEVHNILTDQQEHEEQSNPWDMTEIHLVFKAVKNSDKGLCAIENSWWLIETNLLQCNRACKNRWNFPFNRFLQTSQCMSLKYRSCSYLIFSDVEFFS